ncbi:methylmalonyl-CoA mutase [Nocardioides sp. KC13]|uniref:Methylmalonyl-CoA mutase n=1 Tax=Nocardioides turkmenicus TaxID=2711220 RepID=A0A6M1R2Y9_9ACTN|nr:methylmalonyl-CoA mutase family protein [Nocardioides sp. KC13]NGN94092.1 methylmalonyl-CoA mutase [Nocardioides sp. KC13]
MNDAARADSLRLAQPADAHSQAEWEAATAAVLRKSGRLTADDADALVWDKLTRTSLDGLRIAPLGLPGESYADEARPTRSGAWDIRSLVSGLSGVDAKAANEAALVDLDGGVSSLWVAADETTDLNVLLDKVLLDLAPIVLDAPIGAVKVAQNLLALIAERGTGLHAATNLGADPMGALLRDLPLAPDEAFAELVDLARLAQGIGVRAIVVDATAAHDLGASDVQELGWSIAVGVAYLRALTEAGFSPAIAANLIEFRYAATDEQFPTIAKLRAARQLWARVLELSGAEGVEMRIHAASSRPMLSKYDPYVNMLRGTVAAFAAGVGGADAVTVLPFDSANGVPDGFGRRIARNVSHLLIDESHVAAVADPAGGSYAVEKLTADMAEAGWEAFIQLEEEWTGATTGGHDFSPFRDRIAAVSAEREKAIARRKRPITGLTEFPNLAETLPERPVDPLNERVVRYGASFEALRDTPATAKVFLATLGTVAQHTARATFATNLLAAGGIGVDVAGATADAEELAGKYRAAGAPPVVCLAGSDKAYAAWGSDAIAALREAGATHVIIAGKPDAVDAEVDDAASLGVDALAFLTATREKLS